MSHFEFLIPSDKSTAHTHAHRDVFHCFLFDCCAACIVERSAMMPLRETVIQNSPKIAYSQLGKSDRGISQESRNDFPPSKVLTVSGRADVLLPQSAHGRLNSFRIIDGTVSCAPAHKCYLTFRMHHSFSFPETIKTFRKQPSSILFAFPVKLLKFFVLFESFGKQKRNQPSEPSQFQSTVES